MKICPHCGTLMSHHSSGITNWYTCTKCGTTQSSTVSEYQNPVDKQADKRDYKDDTIEAIDNVTRLVEDMYDDSDYLFNNVNKELNKISRMCIVSIVLSGVSIILFVIRMLFRG